MLEALECIPVLQFQAGSQAQRLAHLHETYFSFGCVGKCMILWNGVVQSRLNVLMQACHACVIRLKVAP